MNAERVIIEELDRLAQDSVRSALEKKSGLVLFSGGIDSAILATLVARKVDNAKNWALFTLGAKDSPDTKEYSVPNSQITSAALPFSNLRRITREVDAAQVVAAARATRSLVSVTSFAHYEDCTAFFLICEEARRLHEPRPEVLLAANAPDELFCGYDRFRRIMDVAGSPAVKSEIENALVSAALLQAEVKKIAAHFNLEILEPFFEPRLVDFCLKVPVESKILRNDFLRKRIWRDYGIYLGLPEKITQKPKKAMQYSMGIHKLLLSMEKNLKE